MNILRIVSVAAVASAGWILLVGYTTVNGWWHTPLTDSTDPAAFRQAAMAYAQSHNRGNFALVLIEDGERFAEGFLKQSQKIDRDTLFPTASLSKWITALGVMHLAQSGRVELDAPVSTYLRRWQIPDSPYQSAAVTVRQLLSHTAGLTDGLGFGEYAIGETLPSLVESLNNPRSSSGEKVQIVLGRTPGSEWDYSGGGYLILQLLIEDVTGQTFPAYMQSSLLDPLGMSRSTYGFPGLRENAANVYNPDGTPAELYQYAASAATGFASTAADLTRLADAVLNDRAPDVIAQDTLRHMRAPQASLFGFEIWGLGTILYAGTGSGDFVYGHDGQNEPAINSSLRINPASRDAFIALASGNRSLATYLGFEWVFWQTGKPDFLGLGYVTDSSIRIALVGLGVIWLLAAVLRWISYRRRHVALS
ncbi:MAG: serine hydrolase domain-containing protein [Pseudomonadales bacterium]